MTQPIDILAVAEAQWTATQQRLADMRRTIEPADHAQNDYLDVWSANDIAMDDVDTVRQIIAAWPK